MRQNDELVLVVGVMDLCRARLALVGLLPRWASTHVEANLTPV